MSQPISFPSTTPQLSLPLLFAGQAQKEFFINQALSVVDALASSVVLASIGTPPDNASDGACYRITSPASGDWDGHEDQIAIRIAGAWHYVEPVNGMRMFDGQIGAMLLFDTGWQFAAAPATPTGGATIDVEARQTLSDLIMELRRVGLFTQ